MLAVQVARRKVDGAEVAREAQLGGSFPSLKLTALRPLKIGRNGPQKGLGTSNHPFFRGENVSFRAGNTRNMSIHVSRKGQSSSKPVFSGMLIFGGLIPQEVFGVLEDVFLFF